MILFSNKTLWKALLLIVIAVGCTREIPEQSTNLVTSWGMPFLTIEEFEKAFRSLKGRFSELSADALFDVKNSFLEEMIDERLVLQEGNKRGIHIETEEVERTITFIKGDFPQESFNEVLKSEFIDFETWKKALQKKLLIRKIIMKHVFNKIYVMPLEVKREYMSKVELFFAPERIKALQIVVSTDTEARKILRELRAGKDFSSMAKKYSLSPDGNQGGDLGFFGPGQMPKEFDEVLFSLPVGKLSDVVASPYGYHIFLVESRQEARRLRFSEVKETLEAKLRGKKEKKAYESWLATLRKKAHIEIQHDLLKHVHSREGRKTG